jgi:hypothetical protein
MQNKYYIIVNKQGEAYIGMIEGSLAWSDDWNQGKKLLHENTTRILEYTQGAELVEL